MVSEQAAQTTGHQTELPECPLSVQSPAKRAVTQVEVAPRDGQAAPLSAPRALACII